MKSEKAITHKALLADMRSSALRARAIMHPDYCNYNFSARMRNAAVALQNAINYRDMAKRQREVA